MKNELKVNIEGSDLEFSIEPFGYDEERNNFYCTLKLVFESNSTDLIKLLKLYRNVADIQKEHYNKDENGAPIFLSDIYNLKLEFLRFDEEEI